MNWFRTDDPALTAVPSASVGLLVGLNPPPHWGDAVRGLAGYADVRIATPGLDDVDSWLASSSGAPGLERARATGQPVVVLPPEPPAAGLDVRSIPPVTPFVRSRWRRRFGLPADLVVTFAHLPDDLRPTALAVAAAVVVGEARVLLEALAWGAPTVTDGVTAEAVGARIGVEVVAGGLDEAHALAADMRRAAALARAGRRLVERLHDPVEAAAALRRGLGLTARPSPWEEALDDLWTPPDARIRRRAAELVAL